MPDFRFTYKNPKSDKPCRDNILFEADNREDAIALFESDFPELKWYIITEL
ncbi:hypothetical protein [Christiangramia sp.]|uniref:hypothetical protein n=1 Tax=Christiangramia sp. TaxID=1931228 RepID=UPI00261C5E78|nr:hypothetical protein [Christiangramia sp.]